VELRHLRYFTAVAENAGIGRAARALHVAQSAISEQIHDLEAELGVALFDRQGRRIRLTYHGEQFLKDARAVLAAADQAVANVQKSLRGEIGTLNIGFFVGGTGTFFSGIIREFRHRFPNVHVSLVETGSIDFAFTRPVQPASATLLRSEHFRRERFYAVLPRNHVLANKRHIRLLELASDLFILNDRSHSPATFDKIITLCSEAGFSPKIGSAATVSSGVIALVEAGEGVAILPEGSRKLCSDDVLFVPLADRSAFIDLVIAWSSQYESLVLGSFLELVRKRRRK
jgi:DNA-binding transcriptional LysR family regulator